jgi:hypothetical protein
VIGGRSHWSPAARAAGIFGVVAGVAAAGLAGAIAVERVLVRRSKKAEGDPYVDEIFGDQVCDETCLVETADGTDVHVEIVEPAASTDRPTVVFVHGFCLDMGTFHFQRKALADPLRPAGARPVRPAGVRRVRVAGAR